MLAAVYHMRIADYSALTRLSEYLRKSHGRHDAASDYRRENIARADGRKLIRITDEDEPCIVRHRVQKRGNKCYVNHRAFVEYDRVTLERVIGILTEDNGLIVIGKLRLEQSVNGKGLLPRKLCHSLCGSARRRGKHRFKLKLLEKSEDSSDRGRLARTGAARDEYNLILESKLQRLPLQRSVFYIEPFFKLVNELVRVGSVLHFAAAHRAYPLGRFGFGLIERGQIAGILICDSFEKQLSVFDEILDAPVNAVCIDSDKLRRCRAQLFARDEAMAVAGIVHEFKDNRRTDPVRAVLAEPHFKRHGVRLGKCAADMG